NDVDASDLDYLRWGRHSGGFDINDPEEHLGFLYFDSTATRPVCRRTGGNLTARKYHIEMAGEFL
ncbi:hypothetical protein, partial [Neisseria gonorrhoeae]|uniref:hypothetical protein n=1 Tax=Neisseria gonorrhoeae TaxID=485 RepID=UPI001B7F963C